MGMNFQTSTMDAVEWLRGMERESVSLCVTDPAYESLEKHRAIGTTTRLTNDWFEIFKNERFPELLSELYRVLAPNSHLYVISDQETMMDVVRPMGRAAGFTFWKFLVWDKQKIGMGYHWRARHEVVSFLEKGKRQLSNLSLPDVLDEKRIRGGYPTEKPVGLLQKLIENSSSPGELVIDPFMGSGSCGEAALRSGRRFAGCDISPRAVQLSNERMALFGDPGLVVRPREQGVLW